MFDARYRGSNLNLCDTSHFNELPHVYLEERKGEKFNFGK